MPAGFACWASVAALSAPEAPGVVLGRRAASGEAAVSGSPASDELSSKLQTHNVQTCYQAGLAA